MVLCKITVTAMEKNVNAVLGFNEQLNVVQSFTFLMSWYCDGVPAEKEVIKSVEADVLSTGQPASFALGSSIVGSTSLLHSIPFWADQYKAHVFYVLKSKVAVLCYGCFCVCHLKSGICGMIGLQPLHWCYHS